MGFAISASLALARPFVQAGFNNTKNRHVLAGRLAGLMVEMGQRHQVRLDLPLFMEMARRHEGLRLDTRNPLHYGRELRPMRHWIDGLLFHLGRARDLPQQALAAHRAAIYALNIWYGRPRPGDLAEIYQLTPTETTGCTAVGFSSRYLRELNLQLKAGASEAYEIVRGENAQTDPFAAAMEWPFLLATLKGQDPEGLLGATLRNFRPPHFLQACARATARARDLVTSVASGLPTSNQRVIVKQALLLKLSVDDVALHWPTTPEQAVPSYRAVAGFVAHLLADQLQLLQWDLMSGLDRQDCPLIPLVMAVQAFQQYSGPESERWTCIFSEFNHVLSELLTTGVQSASLQPQSNLPLYTQHDRQQRVTCARDRVSLELETHFAHMLGEFLNSPAYQQALLDSAAEREVD